MRKILLSLTLSALMLIPFACHNSKQSELPSPQKTNTAIRNTKSAAILGTAAHDFVNTFYSSASYTVGRQVNTTVNSQALTVSEIVVGSEARGYIVTEQATSTPLYFADVDRTLFTMTSIDIATNETIIEQNINQNPEYSLTNGFDFIKVVNDVNNDGGYDNQGPGRPFWGKVVVKGDCIEGLHFRYIRTTQYVFGVKVSSKLTKEGC